MFPLIINPLPILLTLSTAFGVLVHDIKLDQITAVASLPATAVIGYGALDFSFKGSEHTHTDRLSSGIHQSQPVTQPRNDDKKYIAHKKLAFNSSGSEYQWPSE